MKTHMKQAPPLNEGERDSEEGRESKVVYTYNAQTCASTTISELLDILIDEAQLCAAQIDINDVFVTCAMRS